MKGVGERELKEEREGRKWCNYILIKMYIKKKLAIRVEDKISRQEARTQMLWRERENNGEESLNGMQSLRED